MSKGLGIVKEIAASGNWGLGIATNSRDLFYSTLRKTRRRIQISTYSLGKDNAEVNEFFEIIEMLLKNQRDVNLIVNDDGKKDGTCSYYAKKKIAKFAKKFPEKFTPQFFHSKPNKILHAKIIVVDSKVALVGSMNISKGALVSNYEVMLKVVGPASAKLSLMLDNLSEQLRTENE